MDTRIAAFCLGLSLLAAPAGPYTYTTQQPPGIAAPATIQSRLGTLSLPGGVPNAATVQKLYDNLDFERAVQAYLMALAPVNQAGMRAGIRRFGPDNVTDVMWEQLVDARTIELTANDNLYSFVWLDTHAGPLVLNVPPLILGTIDDFWYRWVSDLGVTGPDRGRGGKYLLLPPGYTGPVPSGYNVLRSRTYGNWFAFVSLVTGGDSRPAIARVKAMLKIYRLGHAAGPPPMRFPNASGVYANFVNRADFGYWKLLNQVVQEEPSDSLDANTLGLYASIGIVKGRPFAPGARMTRILTEAAAVGDATARALAFRPREPAVYYYPHSAWQRAFVGGYKFEVVPGVRNLDAYAMYSFVATSVTPAMAEQRAGQGPQYAWATRDAAGNALDGSKTYKLHLPPHVPVKAGWSVLAYDNQFRSMLQTGQRFPGADSLSKDVVVNADKSVDVYFAPKRPPGKVNWVQTIPGAGWNVILRLHGALAPWFDRTWRPGEIEPSG